MKTSKAKLEAITSKGLEVVNKTDTEIIESILNEILLRIYDGRY